MAPRSDNQALAVARLFEFAVSPDALIRSWAALAKNVVPRGHMEHRYADARRMAIDVRAIPVFAVVSVCHMRSKIGRRLLEDLAPVLDRQMAIPSLSERREGVEAKASLPHQRKFATFYVVLGFFEKVIPLEPLQGVKALKDRIRNHPSPERGSAGVIDPACVIVRRCRDWSHYL